MRSTRTRTRFASSSESGLFSGNSGTTESTARSVSLSMNTCLMNFSAEKQSTGSSSPQEACGNFARICSQYLPAELRQAPAGSTIWVCTSKMNSSPSSASAAAAVSNALSLGNRKRPPMLPSLAKASFKVSNVVAAPQSDCRNVRRPIPTRSAFSLIRNSASRLACATGSVRGTGRNSPLEVASTLIGSGPLIWVAMAPTFVVALFFDRLEDSDPSPFNCQEQVGVVEFCLRQNIDRLFESPQHQMRPTPTVVVGPSPALQSGRPTEAPDPVDRSAPAPSPNARACTCHRGPERQS